MRNGQFAIYNGEEYSAGMMNADEVVLCSSNPADIEKGFVTYFGYNKEVKYVKYVSKSEIMEFYSISLYTFYMGYKAYIMGEKDGNVAIVIENLLPDYAKKLKMDRAIDNGIYEKWIKRQELEIFEEKNIIYSSIK